MFVAATIAGAIGSGPVRIRNMSADGALVEGEILPCIGEPFRLLRGGLSAFGKVVWREDGRAGLRFDDNVDVVRWLAVPSSGQELVDQTFRELKARAVDPPAPLCPSTGGPPASGWQLASLAEALEALADDLAEDAKVVAELGERLQILDVASQVLRRFAGPPVR